MYFCGVIRVALIGSGNLAHHLGRALWEAPTVDFCQWMARRPEQIRPPSPQIPTGNIGLPAQADVCILAVSDRAIGGLAEMLGPSPALVAHTSGATPIDHLEACGRPGVFYPLQTFTAGQHTSLEQVPFLLEAASIQDLALLETLATALGGRAVHATSEARIQAHLAAVFANNFSNHMIALGQELCRAYHLDPEILGPITAQTFAKLQGQTAHQAQTGPARRGDTPTLERHRHLLADTPFKDLYNLITHSIQTTYEDEL